MEKKLVLKKLTIANLTNAELDQVRGGHTWTYMEWADCDAKGAKAQKINQDGTFENSCETGLHRCA